MKLTANDTLHISAVKAENILPGEEFDASDDLGRQLVERGLAAEAKARNDDAAVKAEPSAPANKMEDSPFNKSKTEKKGN